MSGPMESKVRIEPVRLVTAANALASQIRENILSGQIEAGTSLAPERILVKHAGISRASVREAIRILETEGLVETRPGRNGGAWVRQPDHGNFKNFLNIFIRSRKLPIDDLAEARVAIESAAAGSAALRRTAEDLAEIERHSEAVAAAHDDLLAQKDANLAWHRAVAHASHNEFLIAIFEALVGSIDELHRLDYVNAVSSPEEREQGVKAHRAITAAIKAKDAEAAKRRMTRHLSAYGELAGKFSAIEKD